MAQRDRTESTEQARPIRQTSSFVPAIGVVRITAALMIFGFHSWWFLGATPLRDLSEFTLSHGAAGVSLLFLLSGYVYALTRRDESPSSYYRRRAIRLVPLYWVVWIFSLVGFAVFKEKVDVVGVLLSAVLLQSWSPNPEVHYAVTTVGWAISAEFFFVLLAPWLRLHRFSSKALRTALMCLLAGTVVVHVLLQVAQLHFVGDTLSYWSYIFPPTRALEFILGAIVGTLYVRRESFHCDSRIAVAFAIASYVVAGWAPITAAQVAVTLPSFVLLLVSFSSSRSQGSTAGKKHSTIGAVSVTTYAFFLVHFQFIKAWDKTFDVSTSVLVAFASWLVVFGVASTLALVIRRGIEVPLGSRLSKVLASSGPRSPRRP